MPKGPIDDMFEDVYKSVPKALEGQRQELKAHLRKYGDNYDLKNFKDGVEWPTS